ncbi:hypothetical protein AERO_16810, partial [Aeromicrobium fastidiosum]
MAESSQDHSTPDFGTNQWLVEEMHDRYREDPSSVDETWVAFFTTGDGAGLSAPASTNGTAPAAAAVTPPTSPASDTPPAPKTTPATAA